MLIFSGGVKYVLKKVPTKKTPKKDIGQFFIFQDKYTYWLIFSISGENSGPYFYTHLKTIYRLFLRSNIDMLIVHAPTSHVVGKI